MLCPEFWSGVSHKRCLKHGLDQYSQAVDSALVLNSYLTKTFFLETVKHFSWVPPPSLFSYGSNFSCSLRFFLGGS